MLASMISVTFGGFDGRNRRPPSQKEKAQQSKDSQGYQREHDTPQQRILHSIASGLAKAAALLWTESLHCRQQRQS